MKTLFSTLIAFGLTLSFTIAQTNPSITIYFERNSAELSEEALSELSDFVEAFGLRPLANIRISGHTDADGSEAYNRTLSLERTSSVKDYIQQNQRLPDAVILNGFGESAPIADNASAKGQGLNRRVEVVVELSKAGYSDSWKRFEPKSQIFERDASAAFELKGTGGTIIKFPAEAFVDGYGNSVDGMVEIALTEYINPSDFLFGGLHTQSDERLLETGGTVFIEAKNNAGRLKLKDDKTIELGFATRVEGDNMQTFYGEVSENGLNWRAAAQASNSAVAFNSFRYLSEHVEGNIVTAEMIDVNGVKSLKTYTLDGRVPTDSIQIEQYKKQGEITSLMLKSSKLGWINCSLIWPQFSIRVFDFVELEVLLLALLVY